MAEARGERLDSQVRAEMNQVIHDLAADPNPMNLYQIAQVVAFTVNELEKPMSNWMDLVSDHKKVGATEDAAFRIRMNNVRAYIQAKGATTARSKVADKQFKIDTVTISTRPSVNLIELQYGRINMSDIAMEAARQMANQKVAYVQKVLNDAAANWTSPFYAEGAGVVKTTLNPMIQHWMRTGGVALLGDIAVIGKLAEQTGFTASSTTQQYDPAIIHEYNQTGRIGTYMGANVIEMVNAYNDDGLTTQLDQNKIFILPTAVSADQRNLKTLEQGDVISVDHTSINDLTYEIRMDENFGAAMVVGTTPNMGVYVDTTL